MLSSIAGSQSSDTLTGIFPQPTTPSGSIGSFTDQLAAALEGYLAQSGQSSNLEIDIQTTKSQDSGVSQFLVTVKNPDSASGTPADVAVPAASAQAVPAQAPVSQNPALAEIDAYWAAQPPAVQQLRNVSDFGQRSILAQQLADQGYTIDRAVMVWGWDPLKTMATRQMYGYSWVPSYNQASVTSPGMALPGETPYDPSNPPPGSIAVNTDFANGLGITDPWA
jgi:hypothetical protein